MGGCVVDINPRLVAFELREYEVKSWFPTEQDHYLTSSNKKQNMDHFYMIKENTVYNVEMYRKTYKYQWVYDSLYPITLYGQIIEFFILRTRRYIHVLNFFHGYPTPKRWIDSRILWNVDEWEK